MGNPEQPPQIGEQNENGPMNAKEFLGSLIEERRSVERKGDMYAEACEKLETRVNETSVLSPGQQEFVHNELITIIFGSKEKQREELRSLATFINTCK